MPWFFVGNHQEVFTPKVYLISWYCQVWQRICQYVCMYFYGDIFLLNWELNLNKNHINTNNLFALKSGLNCYIMTFALFAYLLRNTCPICALGVHQGLSGTNFTK